MAALGFGLGLAVGCGDPAPPIPIVKGGTGGGGGEGGGGGAGPTTEGIISESSQSSFESDPQLAVNGDVVAVVWTARDTPASPATIGYAISTDGGANFSDPQHIISPEDHSYEGADVVVDNGGTIHVAFIGHARIGGGAAIYVATAPSGGTTLADPEALTAPAQAFYGRPRLTLTNTARLVVAYTETVGETAELRTAVREQTSTEWTDVDANTGGGNIVYPTLCAAADTLMGRTFMVYATQGRIALQRSEDNGDTWQGTQASADGDSISGPPSCVASGLNVWVSYGTRGNIGLDEIKVAYSPDGGESIMDVGVVSDPEAKPLFSLHALAVQPTETGHLVYYNGNGVGAKDGSLRRVRFTPANLMEPMNPMPDDPPLGLPSVLVTEPLEMNLATDDTGWLGTGIGFGYEDSDLYIAYVDNRGEAGHIAFKVVTP